MLQGLNGVPTDNGDCRGEERRQALRLLDQAPTLCETGVLIRGRRAFASRLFVRVPTPNPWASASRARSFAGSSRSPSGR
jgi:hypothetical protein